MSLTNSSSIEAIKESDISKPIAAENAESPILIKEKKKGVTKERKSEILNVIKKNIPYLAGLRRETIRKNAKFAKLCILDAFQGRLSNGLANNSKKSKIIYTMFRIQTSTILFRLVISACIFHTFSLFFEPTNACSSSRLYKFLQYCVILVYAFDIGLKMGYEGLKEYFKHDWQRLYAIVVFLDAIDLLVNGCTYYSNPFRPVVSILRARNGRRFFEVLKKMVPGMSHSLVPILFFIVVLMSLSSLFFSHHIEQFKSPLSNFYGWYFLIFTNDNFEQLLPFHLHTHLAYLTFFFPAIYVGQRFLFNLIIGDTYETFRSFVKKQVKKEKLKEIQGLTKAFTVLDDKNVGSISSFVWRECLREFNPSLSNEAIALYYELISGGSPTISILQFLSLKNVLSFKLSLKDDSHGGMFSSISKFMNRLKHNYQNFYLSVPSSWFYPCNKFLKRLEKGNFFSKVNIVDLVLLCFSLHDFPILQLKASGFELVITPCLILTLIYFGEFFLRLVFNEGSIYSVHMKSNVISFLFAFGNVGVLVYSILVWHYHISEDYLITIPLYEYSFPIHKLLLLFRSLRGIRIANLNEVLRSFNSALIDVIPALLETFYFTFVITYIFGTAGNLIFGSYMEEWSTPLLAVIKSQELTYMVNFLGSMEDTMVKVHPAASIYFIFFLILSLAVSNIALSIIIDLHANILDGRSAKERDGERNKIDIVFERIVAQARTRAVFHRNGANSLNFKNITMSNIQSSGVRHFVAQSKGGNDGLKLEDLKLCQKYAKVDLIKHYNEVHRNHKDLDWEVDFIKDVFESGLQETKEFKCGDTIFESGQPAVFLYLIISGTVRVTRDESNGIALLSATSFIGFECLQPNGSYSMNCVAGEKGVSCLKFKQEDIAHKLDLDLCGSFFRMCHKSSTQLENSFAEFKRKSTRKSIIM